MTVEMIEPANEPATEQANTLPAAPEARAALALNASETEKTLRELATKYTSITEVKDKAGREQAHNATMTLLRARTSIKKVADEAREDAKKFNAAVIAEEKRLTAIVEPEEKRLKALRDEWDAAEEARKQAEAAAERARVLAITERITGLRNMLTLASQCRSSERIQGLFDKLNAEEVTEAIYAEFTDDAAQVKAETLARIKLVLDAKLAEEAERRAEQERIEAARLAAAEAQRLADEAAARVAAQQAELERQQRELAEQQAAFKRQQDEVAAAAQAAAEAAQAEQEAAASALAAAAAPSAWPDADGVVDAPAAPVVPEPIPGIDNVVDAEVTAQDLADYATDAAPAKVIQLIHRPTDAAILAALASHFGVSQNAALNWLYDLDLDALSADVADLAAA